MLVLHHVFLLEARRHSVLLVLSVFLIISGCQTSPDTGSKQSYSGPILRADKLTHANETHTLKKLYQQYQAWQGTPYRLGGQSRAGIDCSAFVQLTFDNLFDIKLPRTTSQQLRTGKKIGRSDLQAGDLVFFRNGRHVGIYLENDRFLHASTRLGVTISKMNNVYWSRYYWRSIRLRPQQ